MHVHPVEDEIRNLRASLGRQRIAIVLLAAAVSVCIVAIVVRPAKDGHFSAITCDTITCESWHVVDSSGDKLLTAYVSSDGNAHMWWYGESGKAASLLPRFPDRPYGMSQQPMGRRDTVVAASAPVNSVEIPQPLTDEQIAAMTRAEANEALGRVSRARSLKNLDIDTERRLRDEFYKLINRQNTAP